MSLASPAKQERIDRHLSRQRGAGVRSLATSFGFAFGIAPQISAVAPSHPEEPPAKRRKSEHTETGRTESKRKAKDAGGRTKPKRIAELAEDRFERIGKADDAGDLAEAKRKAKNTEPKRNTGDVEGRIEPQRETEDSEGHITVKWRAKEVEDCSTSNVKVRHLEDAESLPQKGRISKPRRRFEPAEDEPRAVKAVAGDDSFEAIKKTTKKRGRPKKCEVQVEADALPLPAALDEVPSGRPKRRAATAAMTKVSEGLIEEELSIDKKRRDPEPEKTVRRGRKKAVEVASNDPDAGDAPQVDTESVALLQQHETDAPGLHRERKAELKLGRHGAEEPKPRRKRKLVHKGEQASSKAAALREEELVAKRVPLAETNSNSALRSASPEKPAHKIANDETAEIREKPSSASSGSKQPISKEDEPRRKTRKATKVVVNKDMPEGEPRPEIGSRVSSAGDKNVLLAQSKKPSSHGASQRSGFVLSVPDEGITVDEIHEPKKPRGKSAKGTSQHKKTTKTSPAKTGTSSEGTDPPAQAVTKNREESKRERKRTEMQKIDPVKDVPSPQHPDDEDVDWLFDEHHTKTIRSRKQTRTAKTSKREQRSKLPDMDLDDLLSNIATFVPPSMRPPSRLRERP